MKTQKKQLQEERQLRWFQWEFLRRNSEYRCELDALISQFGSWLKKKGFWYERDKDYSDQDLIFYFNKVVPAIMAICEKWCICQPLPPDWDFDQHTGLHYYRRGCAVSLPTGYTAEAARALWDEGEDEIIGLAPQKSEPFSQRFIVKKSSAIKPRMTKHATPSDRRYLTVTLDATKPMNELMDQLKRELRLHRLRNAVSLPTGSHLGRSRRRFDQYGLYLRVWDLCEREGLQFPDIARQVFPKETSPYARLNKAAIQKVRDHYRRAKELINGGYKEIA